MSKVKLIAKLCNQITYDALYDYIGVDKGALTCLKENIPMVCALGDFDSIDKEEYELLNKNTPIIKLPEEKDESDGEYAITYAVHKGYNEIEVEGAIGGRIDHFMALYLKMIMSNSNIKIKDGQNVIYTLPSGTHKIKKLKNISHFLLVNP